MESVSVVIPTFNRAALLCRALRSVLAAIEDGDEVIVVDDGSTDNTAALVDAADAPWRGRVKYLSVPNGGAGRARNIGVEAAANDLIAFADSDDTWQPYRLSIQRQLLTSERALGFCFSNFSQLLRNGDLVRHWLVEWTGDRRSWDTILAPGRAYREMLPLPAQVPPDDVDFRIHIGSMYYQELFTNYVNVNTVLARRSVLGDALQFGLDLPTYEDWECFARISRVGSCAYLDIDTAVQVGHDGPRLTQTGLLASAQARIAVIERIWGHDEAFMRTHGTEVMAVLNRLRRSMVRRLIREGRSTEARELLKLVDGAWIENIALLLPSTILRVIAGRL